MSDNMPVAAPVKAVNNDHQITIRINTLLCPMRSLNIPEGISKSA